MNEKVKKKPPQSTTTKKSSKIFKLWKWKIRARNRSHIPNIHNWTANIEIWLLQIVVQCKLRQLFLVKDEKKKWLNDYKNTPTNQQEIIIVAMYFMWCMFVCVCFFFFSLLICKCSGGGSSSSNINEQRKNKIKE